MLRALPRTIGTILISILVAVTLVVFSVIAAVLVLAYGTTMALWPRKRSMGTVLLERALKKMQ